MSRDDDNISGGGGGGGGAVAWLRRWWRALLSELIATALLVALGVGSLLPVRGQAPPLTHPALAFAFVVTANAQAFGAVSGAHMNPAVSLAALLHGRLPAAAAAGYAAAQLAGAVLGLALLRAVAPAAAAAGAFGVTAPAPGVSPAAALLVEALLTGTLALAVCAVWAEHEPARPDHSAPVKLGLTVGGLVYAGGELTGASLNPARSLAPALLLGEWRAHWVYWAGPLAGAAAAALLHRWVLLPPPGPPHRPHTHPHPHPHPHPAPEELPLRDKRPQDC